MMNQVAEDVVLEAVLGVHLSEEDKAMVDGLSAVEDAGEARKQQKQKVSRCQRGAGGRPERADC